MDLIKEREINGKRTWFGFSLGGYALMDLATKVNFDKIVLISPTPLFLDTIAEIGDDYVKMENGDKDIREMCSMISCPVEVYVGELERPLMKDTAQKIATFFNVDLQVMKNMDHNDKLFRKVLKIETNK